MEKKFEVNKHINKSKLGFNVKKNLTPYNQYMYNGWTSKGTIKLKRRVK